jgi:hypothetical protein
MPPEEWHVGSCEVLKEDPLSGHLFVFFNRRRNRTKFLLWNRSGLCLCYERLENAAILYSLVVSCKLAGVEPFTYLRDVLMRIHTHAAERVAELIPREWKTRFGPEITAPVPSAAWTGRSHLGDIGYEFLGFNGFKRLQSTRFGLQDSAWPCVIVALLIGSAGGERVPKRRRERIG